MGSFGTRFLQLALARLDVKVVVKSYYEPSGPSGRSLSPVSVA